MNRNLMLLKNAYQEMHPTLRMGIRGQVQYIVYLAFNEMEISSNRFIPIQSI